MTTQKSSATPLVAVVTPVYNGAEFLAETLESVQAQTYPSVVHVVLDNASTDATPEILKRYAGGRVPLMVVRNDSVIPIGANWNTAVRLTPADAKYFRVLCADDLLLPDFVARTVDVAERRPSVEIVGCSVNHRGAADAHRWDAGREVFDGREATERFFRGQGQIIAHQTLIRRRHIERRPVFFDDTLVAYDTDAVLDILRHGDWGFVHETLAVTRDHPATQSTKLVDQMKLHMSDYLVLLERYAEFAFGPEEGARQVRKYRRSYLRRLLRLRLKAGEGVYDRHMKTLATSGVRAHAWDYVDAVTDWPLTKLGLRPAWTGYPF